MHDTEAGERAGSLSSPATAADAVELAAVLSELEALSRFDRDGIGDRAQAAQDAARALDVPELELRARLVAADLARRRGDVAEAGRVAREVQRWATDAGSRHLLSRSHFLLAAVFQELGDLSLALEHAVQSVDLLGDDGPPAQRIDHLARLADCQGLQGDEGARERYAEVLGLAAQLGDVDRQLLILNNWAYVETIAGRYDGALTLSTQLQALSDEQGVVLHVGRLDTIARALLGLGRLEEAENALAPGTRPGALDASSDGDAGADFLLTLAEVRRRRGRVAGAQQALDECVRRCEQHGLTAIRVRARREQAELHAAGADFRAAFEEHQLYCQAALDLQSVQRDARARALQAMYETTEARRQSRRYRELSLRDPLTGLYNRRFVDDQLPQVLDRATAADEVVSVALVDLDHFKRVNDTWSHDVGDQVLRAVAARLEVAASGSVVPGGFAARMGGEEFLLVLVGGDLPRAVRQLDDLRREVAAHPWGDLADDLAVTLSAGVSTTAGDAGATIAGLLSRADEHLYGAKTRGRDLVVSDLG
ncbi:MULTISPECIES: GGDEF domain-containing protein [unclassified Modestobacter]|uniref:GGDEF domain-containing protein n=1 Tax=unclassified Modestobacter TaxID=2643866 RepID=UPI0022AA0AF9|nr:MULTISPECIES: diguanylate cyclase [unclassified Modestobacter]MCZ2823672.1 diguanylate cyclase [Modestobacter sp. VKM Ac-2981]MCZ2851917.1 diguanylate cyclase [Modestobacter sp. VKM Ac-2982]